MKVTLDQIKVINNRCDALNGVFDTVTIQPLKKHDVHTFLKVSGDTISKKIPDAIAKKKCVNVQLVLKSRVGENEPREGENT